MRIDVVASVNEIKADELVHKTAIVIDALRATSVMITALEHGATSIATADTVGAAIQLSKSGDLLGGERYCRKISGFDLGNSPLEYTFANVNGRHIILTTTNGTRCLQKAHKAAHLLVGAFINGRACARTALLFKRDIVILCAGSKQLFAWEDGLCAGYITDEIMATINEQPLTINDLGLAMLSSYHAEQLNIMDALSRSQTGIRLGKLGFTEDILYCAELDRTQMVPIMQAGQIVPFTTDPRSKSPVLS